MWEVYEDIDESGAPVFLVVMDGKESDELDSSHKALAPASFRAAQLNRELEASAREWRREMALETGMAFGCDGYNDVMGY